MSNLFRLSSSPRTALLAMLAAAAAIPAARADEEIIIGQDGAGRLVVHIHIEQPLVLEPSPFAGIDGYATGSHGFHSAEIDMPDEGVLMLDPSADIEATLVGADLGARIFDSGAFLTVGGTMRFGTPFFDYHPVFNISHGTPGVELGLRLIVRDRAGIYADSQEFTVLLAPAFCPADFDSDGTVDFFDYDAFVVCFEDPSCAQADFDGDGTTDFFDYDAFVIAFEAPC